MINPRDLLIELYGSEEIAAMNRGSTWNAYNCDFAFRVKYLIIRQIKFLEKNGASWNEDNNALTINFKIKDFFEENGVKLDKGIWKLVLD